MNREYHKRYSSELHREIEMLVLGHGGMPLLVFPTSQGRFYEYEDRGMIGALSPKIEHGELQVFCPDSVDSESWKNQSSQLAVTGCSFGGYHAVNFSLKHPNVVTHCVAMSGAYDIHQFLDGYYDDDCYFNCPPDFLPNMNDEWFLSRYRQMRIVLASGEWDMCLDANVKLSAMLHAKGVPHWLDVWGDHTGHDWPWWVRMAVKYF